MAKKEPVLCAWCPAEAEVGVEVVRQPACEGHRRQIEAEMKVNAGRAVPRASGQRDRKASGS
jgi:hypothetical protein